MKIYILENEDTDEYWFFRKKKYRKILYERLLMLSIGEHYISWCELQNLKCYKKHSWKRYLKSIKFNDPYFYSETRLHGYNEILDNLSDDNCKEPLFKK